MVARRIECPNCQSLLNMPGDAECQECGEPLGRTARRSRRSIDAPGVLVSERSLFNIGFYVGLGFLSAQLILALIAAIVFVVVIHR